MLCFPIMALLTKFNYLTLSVKNPLALTATASATKYFAAQIRADIQYK